jgi:DNA-directed RNA polymerase subunit beta'
MVIGAYYLTEAVKGAKGEGRVFRHMHDLDRAYEEGELDLHAEIEYRGPVAGVEGPLNTTYGRLLFNEALPDDLAYVNRAVKKGDMGAIVDELANGKRWISPDGNGAQPELIHGYPKAVVADSLDGIKNLCFKFAARSGLTISIEDVKTPTDKREILDGYEKRAEKVEDQFFKGIITDGERRQKEVEIWTAATEEVRAAMERELKRDQFNPIDMMVGSGARGNMMQVRQIAGMRGLVANPRGDMIPRPIKSNFREGLAMLEYFIATPGARKGLVDTALRTADSGYLTRRLVDVAQELIVREEDCEREGVPVLGLWLEDIAPDPADGSKRNYLETRVFGRTIATDVKLSDGTVLPAGHEIGDEDLEHLRDDETVTRVRVRSPLTCQAELGVCRKCYGRSLATGKTIELGEAVGVIAAQSIGEPGTQLTMRTFHTGGIAGTDIAGGLPRVVELFEARSPKGKATLARTSGVVRISEDEGKGRVVTIVADDGSEETHSVPTIQRLAVVDGQEVRPGDAIVGEDKTPRDPKELLEIRGVRETQQYLVSEVQKVYRDQGVSIHDKHIELIVRQMTRRVAVQEPGDSDFLPGERVDSKVYADVNRRLVHEGNTPAEGRPELMGITKASLATDSWLSAASFQETTRVLTEAAIESRSDGLLGLKENIIIGKLIPAGTGMEVYRAVDTEAPDYQPMQFYSSDADAAEWLASISGDYIPEAAAGDGGGDGASEAAPVDEADAVVGEADGSDDGTVIEAPFGEESIG